MKRNTFIKSGMLGVGAAVLSTSTACQSKKDPVPSGPDSKPDNDNQQTQRSKIVRHDEGQKLNVMGDHQVIKLTGQDTYGQFTLIEQENDPGVGIPRHVHENEDEVFQVLEGQVSMIIGEDTVTLSAGDLIFCPRGVPHSWSVVGNQKAKATLSIFPAGLEDMFVQLSELPPGKPDLDQVAQICGRYSVYFV